MKNPKPEITKPGFIDIRGDVKPTRYEVPIERPKPTPKPPKKDK